MGATLPGLLSALLLLLLPASLRVRDHLPASNRREAEDGVVGRGLHPIVLIPGLSCPDLEA